MTAPLALAHECRIVTPSLRVPVRSAAERTGRRIRTGAPREARSTGFIRDDRGDVPGWILITLMTAALVLVVWGLASSSFQQLWERAMGMVDLVG